MIKFCTECNACFDADLVDGMGACPVIGCEGPLVDVDDLMFPVIKAFSNEGFHVRGANAPHVGHRFNGMSLEIDISYMEDLSESNSRREGSYAMLKSLIIAMLDSCAGARKDGTALSRGIHWDFEATVKSDDLNFTIHPSDHVDGWMKSVDFRDALCNNVRQNCYSYRTDGLRTMTVTLRPEVTDSLGYFDGSLTSATTLFNLIKSLIKIADNAE